MQANFIFMGTAMLKLAKALQFTSRILKNRTGHAAILLFSTTLGASAQNCATGRCGVSPCRSNPQHFGHYQTQWRAWPSSPADGGADAGGPKLLDPPPYELPKPSEEDGRKYKPDAPSPGSAEDLLDPTSRVPNREPLSYPEFVRRHAAALSGETIGDEPPFDAPSESIESDQSASRPTAIGRVGAIGRIGNESYRPAEQSRFSLDRGSSPAGASNVAASLTIDQNESEQFVAQASAANKTDEAPVRSESTRAESANPLRGGLSQFESQIEQAVRNPAVPAPQPVRRNPLR
jgi:hypothetical protein